MFSTPISLVHQNAVLCGNGSKAFADDKIKVPKLTIFVFDRVENTLGKGENAGYQHFLLFPQCFQRDFYPGSLKDGIAW